MWTYIHSNQQYKRYMLLYEWTYYNRDGPQKIRLNERSQIQSHISPNLIYTKHRKHKSIETGNRLVVACGWDWIWLEMGIRNWFIYLSSPFYLKFHSVNASLLIFFLNDLFIDVDGTLEPASIIAVNISHYVC